MKNKKTYVVHTDGVYGKAGESVVKMSEAADVKREYVSVFLVCICSRVHVCVCVPAWAGRAAQARGQDKQIR